MSLTTPHGSDVSAPARTTTTTMTSTTRTLLRWLVSFVGFPIGGLAALFATGPVTDPRSALLGGLVTGAAVGAVQAWSLRRGRSFLLAWTLATAGGLAVGLTVGASVVRFASGLPDLALQGAVSGLAVGVAQAAVLWRRQGRIVLVWPLGLAGVWALGWVVTTLVGVQVGDQFTVFGASGALAVTVLTSVLPLALRRDRTASVR